MTSASPAASSARKSSCAGGRDPQPALDDDEVQPEDREQPDEPELLAERGERVVGVHGRDRQVAADRRQPGAQPDARGCPPRANAYSAWTAWNPVPERVPERVEPVVDALLHVPEQVVQDDTSRRRTARRPPTTYAGAPGRDVQQREEHGEEQERRAEVALDDDDAEGDRPHRDHRREVRERRQADAARSACSPRRAATGSRTGTRPGTRRGSP